MSLVATPVVAARVTAPKKAVRNTMTVKASAVNAPKSAAIAGAVSLTLVAQPALAAVEAVYPVPAAQEIAMVADAGDDAAKKAKAKALALSLESDLVAKDAKEGKKVNYGTAPTKTKSLAAPSAPGGGFSLPKLGGGEKKAPAAKGEKAAPAPKSEGNGKLGLAMAVLFSPLIAVGAFSVSTLLRVIPQAADGKDFFPKDEIPF